MAVVAQSRRDSIRYHLNPLVMVRQLWAQRDLISQFTVREIEGRYRGSNLGLLWSFVHPLVLLIIYTFVFGVVFQARWPQTKNASLAEFALVLFCGIVVFNIFGECVGRAPSLVIAVPNYVKKVVFPLEILAVSALGAALYHAGIGMFVLLLADVIINGQIRVTLILLPLALLPMVPLCLGLGWFLSSLGVFLRDIGYTVGLVVQVLFFITPVFYPIEAVPAPFHNIVAINPLTSVVENARRVVLWGTLPDWRLLGLSLLLNSIVMILGYAWFMKTKKAFADVI